MKKCSSLGYFYVYFEFSNGLPCSALQKAKQKQTMCSVLTLKVQNLEEASRGNRQYFLPLLISSGS